VVSVQCLKPAFTADDEAPVAPPPVTPDSPRRRGRPQKVVAESSAVATPKRKKVTFKLKPKILNQSASTLKEFFLSLASAFSLRLLRWNEIERIRGIVLFSLMRVILILTHF